jgi:hypothetical protein
VMHWCAGLVVLALALWPTPAFLRTPHLAIQVPPNGVDVAWPTSDQCQNLPFTVILTNLYYPANPTNLSQLGGAWWLDRLPNSPPPGPEFDVASPAPGAQCTNPTARDDRRSGRGNVTQSSNPSGRPLRTPAG